MEVSKKPGLQFCCLSGARSATLSDSCSSCHFAFCAAADDDDDDDDDGDDDGDAEGEGGSADDAVQLSEAQLSGSDRDHSRIRQLKAAFLHSVRQHCPLVIHGRPGSGRTSMTAAVCQFARGWLSSPHAVIAARVLSSSPASSNIEYILSNICNQIAEVRAPFILCIQ